MASNAVKLTFWGVRGSTPTPDQATRRYGGNTPCLELETPDGTRFILDCGTGLRMLGRQWSPAGDMDRRVEAHILVTHYHWDHIQGIPFFTPFYSPKDKFHFYSFRSDSLGSDSLKRVLEAQMAHPYFPVDLSAMSASREFAEIAGGDCFRAGGAQVRTRWLNHPQGCLGFRIETPAATVAYATDNEAGAAEHDRGLRELAEGADIFINDAQYSPEQMATHKGWGHSSWLDGVRAAREAGARHLVLFHHDPESSDKGVDSLLRDAREKFENVWAAAEGMVMCAAGGRVEVTIPRAQEGLRRETYFPVQVSGWTEQGREFEEETTLGELSLNGALIYLREAPKLQSELAVTISSSVNGAPRKHLKLRGQVARIEPTGEPGRVGVAIIFTD